MDRVGDDRDQVLQECGCGFPVRLLMELSKRKLRGAVDGNEQMELAGLSEFLCEAGYPSCVHEALVEHDGELRLCLGPLARRAFPFRSGVVQDQI